MKHTKTINVLLALLTAGTVLTACSSDEETPVQVKTYYMTINATKHVSESMARATRALTLTGSTLTASWATSEHVYVQGTLLSDGSKFWFNGTLSPQSEGTNTELNGTISLPNGWITTIVDIITNAPKLNLHFPCKEEPDYSTGQKGTLEDIAKNYDYAIATAVQYHIANNIIQGSEDANFVNQQAIVKFTLKDNAESPTLLNPTKLTVAYGDQSIVLTDIQDAYTTNGNGVLFVAIPGFSDKMVTLTAIVGNDTYTFTRKNVTFENSNYYEINVKMNK